VAEVDGNTDPVSYFRETSPWRWENRSAEYGDLSSPLEQAAKLRAPLLIVHGARDPKVPVEQARNLAKAVPGSTLLVLEDAGHGPVTREQRRKVGEALVDFFGGRL
jgi:dipeptidyl aminopeptidase/acylaminoacyl peptidase